MKNDLTAAALEAYRNSAEYPDHPRLGIYGRINKAFEDGYNTGFIQAALPSAQLAKKQQDEFKEQVEVLRAVIDNLESEIINLVSQLKAFQAASIENGQPVDIDVPGQQEDEDGSTYYWMLS